MSNQPPNVHKDTKIHRDDLEMWCVTAAHCAKFRSALKQIREIEKQGGAASAWWKGIEVVVKREDPKVTMLVAPMSDSKTMVQSVLPAPPAKPVVIIPSAPKPATESQLAILAVLLVKMTTSEIAAALSKPVAAVNSSLQSLKTAGRVSMEVTDSGLVWAKA